MKSKRLHLLLIAVLSISLVCSCSKDDNNVNEPIVPSLTGAITKQGIDFDNPKLECTKVTYVPATSAVTRAKQFEENQYSSIIFDFNDNIQVIIRSIIDKQYDSDPLPTHIYRLLKYCFINDYGYYGYFTFNLMKDGKVVSSENLAPPTNGDWWKMASDDSYFTINLDFKGKDMIYKGQVKYTFDK